MSEFDFDDGDLYKDGEHMFVEYALYLARKGFTVGQGLNVQSPSDAVRFLHESVEKTENGAQVFDPEHAQRLQGTLSTPGAQAYLAGQLNSSEMQAHGLGRYEGPLAFASQVEQAAQQAQPAHREPAEPGPIQQLLGSLDQAGREQSPTTATQPAKGQDIGDALGGPSPTTTARRRATKPVRLRTGSWIREQGPHPPGHRRAAAEGRWPTTTSTRPRQPAQWSGYGAAAAAARTAMTAARSVAGGVRPWE